MNVYGAWAVFAAMSFALCSCGCNSTVHAKPDEVFNHSARIIRDPAAWKSTVSEAIQSIRRLPPDRQQLQLWTEVANDGRYSDVRRRWAILQILDRHVVRGMSLQEVGQLVAPGSWLAGAGIQYVDIIAGWVPLVVRPGETLMLVQPVVLRPPDLLAIYFRLTGRPPIEEVRASLHGRQSGADGIVIHGLAVYVPDEREKALVSHGLLGQPN
jgi:hypothetical protein